MVMKAASKLGRVRRKSLPRRSILNLKPTLSNRMMTRLVSMILTNFKWLQLSNGRLQLPAAGGAGT